MILNYSDFKKLNEQSSNPGSPIDFAITAGANNVPMSDETLNKNQGYPAGIDKSTATLYEMTLLSAMLGKFSLAKPVGTLGKEEADQIIFNGKQIKTAGKIEIEYNNENLNKKIRVSGNGALVLARAYNEFNEIYKGKNKKDAAGILVLELSAKSLYSNRWSIISTGLDIATLKAKLNGKVSLATVAMLDKNGKKDLVDSGKNISGYTIEDLENNYAPSISKIDNGGNRTIVKVPSIPVNTTFNKKYGMYSADELLSNTNKNIRIQIKKSVIDPGLDALANYIPTFFTNELVGLDPTYVNRMTSKVVNNITNLKSVYNDGAIEIAMKSRLKGIEGKRITPPTSKVGTSSSTYKEGES